MDQTPTFLGSPRIRTHSVPSSKVVTDLSYDTVLSELTVKIKTGESYLYKGVPEELYVQFTEATSAGQFFSQNFGKGNYPFTKLVPKGEK